MSKQLKDYSEVELKSIAYDNLVQIENLQANLKTIGQELSTRLQTPKEEPKKK